MSPLDWLAVGAVALLGLAFGSFANVVIWRLPRSESLSVPHSHCPVCESPIRWYDNVPVASWLALRGRCRDCSAPISPRYPIVELLSLVLWLTALWEFGLSWRLPFAIALFYLLLVLSAIDLDTMRLPNRLVGLLGGIGLLGVAASYFSDGTVLPLLSAESLPGGAAVWAATGVLVGAVPALLLSAGYAMFRRREGLGMGDVKLLAVSGLFIGPYAGITLFLGSIIGVLSAMIGRRVEPDAKVPFGPSLALATVVVAVWGRELVSWYVSLL